MDKVVYENLVDAGCGDGLIKKFIFMANSGDIRGQLRLLAEHKEVLLKVYHESLRKIDCLDFLFFYLQQTLKKEDA